MTTTGYTEANPETSFGQCVVMIYGMIGIPLMVLAAVDIGKHVIKMDLLYVNIISGRFLSDVVIFVYSKLDVCGRFETIQNYNFIF